MPHRIALILILLSALPARAQEEPGLLVRPGAWEVRSSTEGQPAVGYQLCFRSGNRDDLALLLPRASGSACPAPSFNSDGHDLVWELDCPAAHLAASARYAVGTELVEGRVEVRSGTPATSHRSSISARYIGACAKD
jgi:hypothetical protein